MLTKIIQIGRWSPGYVLFAGFGGLLVLMGSAGVDALRMMREAKAGNAEIRRNSLSRDHALEEIRAGIYISGTVARDYLLAADPDGARVQRDKLAVIERQTDAALRDYARSANAQEADTFRSLSAEIHTYWKMLDLMLQPEREVQRRRSSYFYNQLVQRRAAMLDLAGRIARWNDQEISTADDRLAAMFNSFRFRLIVILTVTLAGGLALAVATTMRLLSMQRELTDLSSRLVTAQEEERRTISRELHDEVGQSLTALLLEAGAAASAFPGSADLATRLQSVKNMAETSLNSVRNLALLLRPPMLDDLGLVPALEWQAREVSKRTGMKVRILAKDVGEDLPDEYRTCIYRVVQESLNNSVRHSQAHSVQVQLWGGGRKIHLAVQDDGAGFDSGQRPGVGLLGMEERVRRAGGTLRVDSQPGKGTLLSVTLPALAVQGDGPVG